MSASRVPLPRFDPAEARIHDTLFEQARDQARLIAKIAAMIYPHVGYDVAKSVSVAQEILRESEAKVQAEIPRSRS